jgi:hypothetical protein
MRVLLGLFLFTGVMGAVLYVLFMFVHPILIMCLLALCFFVALYCAAKAEIEVQQVYKDINDILNK